MFDHITHDTPLGTIHTYWTNQGLYSLTIGDDPSRQRSGDRCHESVFDSAVVDDFGQRLKRYCRHGQESFADMPVDSNGWTPFMKSVYEACRQIPAGQTLTYKQLAAASGNEKASRAVGAAMARNRILLVIPCHRVIAANGHLRGFSAPGGLITKRALLDLERSVVDESLFATR